MQRLVRSIPTAAALIVGAASFVLSFVALKEVASSVGAVPESLAWLVPIVVDGGVLAGSASLWASSYQQTRRDPVAYLTVATLLAFSVLINVHHAGDTLIAKSIAALPPIVLLACLELVAAGHRRAIQASGSPASSVTSPGRVPDHLPDRGAPTLYPPTPQPAHPSDQKGAILTELDWNAPLAAPLGRPLDGDPAPTMTTISAKHPQTGDAGHVSKAEQIRALYDEYVLAGRDPRDPELPKAIAENIGVVPSYVRRLLKPARGARVRAEAPAAPVNYPRA